MTKRFGRNQKRAMRAEQERLTNQVDHWKKEKRLADQLGQANRETLRDVSRILGQHFIGLPPVVRMVTHMQHNYRIPEMQLPQLLERAPDPTQQEMVAELLHIIECQPMKLRTQIDDIRRQIHFRLRTPDGELGYALSDQAWAEMRNDRRVVEYLAEMVASELAHHFRVKPTMHRLGGQQP
jgi:hypothetical protein